MNNQEQKILDFISDNKDEIISDLVELCKIPSVSIKGKDGYPFSKEVDDALNKSAEMYRNSGFPMEVKGEDGYAISILEGKGDGIGIFAHADVVPVNDDWIKTEPFKPLLENGYLYGRGVADDKCGVVETLYALKALKAAGVEPKSRITVFIGGTEETGMEDIDNFVKNERMPEISVSPDSEFPVSVGEKGIVRVEAKSKKAFEELKAFGGGKAFNVILDKSEVKLKATDAIKKAFPDAEEKDGIVSFDVKGVTAHAAYPEGSDNAAYKAARLLVDSKALCENDSKILDNLSKTIDGYYGKGVNIESEGAFGKLTCANGMVKVCEDGKLYFSLDIRFGSEISSKTILDNIKKAFDEREFEMIESSVNEGFLIDENGKDVEIILSACRDVCSVPDAKPYKSYGGTYARHLKNGFSIDHSGPWDRSVLNLPAGHGDIHQSDEVLCVDAFIKGAQTLAVMIHRLDKYLSEK